MTPAQATLYKQQFDFFYRLINISGLVKPFKKEDRKEEIMKHVAVGMMEMMEMMERIVDNKIGIKIRY